MIGSEIPQGTGLSSSAALEIGIARVAAEIHWWDWDPLEVAKAARRAENDFVGVPSGIMDQVVVAAGSPGHALLLDCLTLAMRHVPIAGSIRVVILDTGTRRKLVQSSYRTRREECERAAAQLGVTALRDASMDSLEAGIRDDGLRRRARHVVSENARTIAAAEALDAGDLDEVGLLMTSSHASLRDDFEVSSPALDLITELALEQPGCIGARMTGAGFAGCAVGLVSRDAVGEFIDRVGPAYDRVGSHESALYATTPSRGVSLV